MVRGGLLSGGRTGGRRWRVCSVSRRHSVQGGAAGLRDLPSAHLLSGPGGGRGAGQGISGSCLELREAVNVEDAYVDARFNSAYDKLVRLCGEEFEVLDDFLHEDTHISQTKLDTDWVHH